MSRPSNSRFGFGGLSPREALQRLREARKQRQDAKAARRAPEVELRCRDLYGAALLALTNTPRSYDALGGGACGGAALLDAHVGVDELVLPSTVLPCRHDEPPLWRYFTLFADDDAGLTCLVFKTPLCLANGITQYRTHGVGIVRGVCSRDGLNFSAAPAAKVLPLHLAALMGHNLALLRAPRSHSTADAAGAPFKTSSRVVSEYVLLGGEGKIDHPTDDAFADVELQGGRLRSAQEAPHRLAPLATPVAGTGILMARGPGWRLGGRAGWEPPRIAIGAQHEGCIDRRVWSGQRAGHCDGCCEFDGRLSAVYHRGAFLLYSRANLRECGERGGRFVQVTSSTDARSWGPMRQISVRGYEPDSGDIYFFAVQPNPVDVDASGGGDGSRSLLALFPLSQPPHACVGLAFSIDGVAWSRVVKLRGCDAAPEGRTVDHPVAGGATLCGDGIVCFHVQHAVPGIANYSVPTRLMRYRLPSQRLLIASRRALRQLRGGK